jgi:5'(3')-deoxyribonucleotidase
LKIALDFDSVLSDTMKSWVSKYNKKHGTAYTKEDIRQWKFWNDFNISRDYAQEFFRESWEDWTTLPHTESNLNQTIDQLSKHGTVDVVTNVDKSHLKYVKKWLAKENISVDDVKHAGPEKISNPYDIFIDDDPDLAEKAKTNNKNCFLYHQKWNVSIQQSDSVIRIYKLTEAIHEIAKKNL